MLSTVFTDLDAERRHLLSSLVNLERA